MTLDSHAVFRLFHGASKEKVALTLAAGERFAAKFGRKGFRAKFRIRRDLARPALPYEAGRGQRDLGGDWLAIGVAVKYF